MRSQVQRGFWPAMGGRCWALHRLSFAAAIPAIVAMRERYGKAIYGRYGFLDAFNPTLRATDAKLKEGRMDADVGWVDDDYLGIDQGPILLMIENHRSGLVWKTMRKNPHIRLGLQRAGFEGGWLDAPQ